MHDLYYVYLKVTLLFFSLDIITSAFNVDDDDDDEINMFIRFERQVRSKIKNFTELTVPNMSDKEFKINFHLTRESIEILILNLSPLFSKLKFKCSIEKQILAFILYIANCETHRTSHGVVINCLEQMNTLSKVFIQWPSGQIETMEKFNSLRETSFQMLLEMLITIILPY
ncbi:hypothetical protein AGLY_010871 [Aphis glycines]|uniref:DDE Tnp4 domain-containing protein n=1 Tax=Aphis glycines TaxID=307491 RepID=A0A6G0TEY7_APHGL|nr:hypothetical protein AGLY_010871 [Aphis glycines]